jgi:hypothetical protein
MNLFLAIVLTTIIVGLVATFVVPKFWKPKD